MSELQRLKKWIKQGKNVMDFQTHQGKNTALHVAVLYEDLELIKFLIEKERLPLMSIQNDLYRTPMDMAFQNGNPRIIQLFMQHGAFPKNPTDYPHLSYTRTFLQRERKRIQRELDRVEDLKKLLSGQHRLVKVVDFKGEQRLLKSPKIPLLVKQDIEKSIVDTEKSRNALQQLSKRSDDIHNELLTMLSASVVPKGSTQKQLIQFINKNHKGAEVYTVDKLQKMDPFLRMRWYSKFLDEKKKQSSKSNK